MRDGGWMHDRGAGICTCIGTKFWFLLAFLSACSTHPPSLAALATCAGGNQRYSLEARGEAAVVLDLLVALLLAPQQGPADEDGLRYVRWACRRLQGGRPPRHSPLWPVYCDALEGLRRCQQGQWPPVLPAGQPGLGTLQQELPLDEPSQPQVQQQEAAPQQQQQQQQPVPAVAAVPTESTVASGTAAAVQPRGGPLAMQSLCVIAGEVAEELARSGRTHQETPQRQGLPAPGGSLDAAIAAAPA